MHTHGPMQSQTHGAVGMHVQSTSSGHPQSSSVKVIFFRGTIPTSPPSPGAVPVAVVICVKNTALTVRVNFSATIGHGISLSAAANMAIASPNDGESIPSPSPW